MKERVIQRKHGITYVKLGTGYLTISVSRLEGGGDAVVILEPRARRRKPGTRIPQRRKPWALRPGSVVLQLKTALGGSLLAEDLRVATAMAACPAGKPPPRKRR